MLSSRSQKAEAPFLYKKYDLPSCRKQLYCTVCSVPGAEAVLNSSRNISVLLSLTSTFLSVASGRSRYILVLKWGIAFCHWRKFGKKGTALLVPGRGLPLGEAEALCTVSSMAAAIEATDRPSAILRVGRTSPYWSRDYVLRAMVELEGVIPYFSSRCGGSVPPGLWKHGIWLSCKKWVTVWLLPSIFIFEGQWSLLLIHCVSLSSRFGGSARTQGREIPTATLIVVVYH